MLSWVFCKVFQNTLQVTDCFFKAIINPYSTNVTWNRENFAGRKCLSHKKWHKIVSDLHYIFITWLFVFRLCTAFNICDIFKSFFFSATYFLRYLKQRKLLSGEWMRDLNMLNFMYSFNMLGFICILLWSERYFLLVVIHVLLLGLIRNILIRNQH